jgi:hypothetical protein
MGEKMMNSKKIIVFFVVSAMLVSSFAGISALQINSDDTNVISLKFLFNKPKISNINLEGKTYTHVSISGLENSENEGSPSLPKHTAKLLLPPKSSVVSVDILKNGKGIINNVKNIELASLLYNPLSDSNLKLVDFDKDGSVYKYNIDSTETEEIDNYAPLYDTTSIYPNQGSYIDLGVQYKRGFPILMVDIFPTQYDTSSQSLIYYTDITLKVTTETDNSLGLNELYRGLDRDFAAVSEIINNPNMINSYKQLNSNQIDAASSSNGEGNLLIITAEAFKNYEGSYNLQNLANAHKNHGINEVFIETVESIYTRYPNVPVGSWDFQRGQSIAIRNCIKDYYMNKDVDYALIVGDDDYNYELGMILPMFFAPLIRESNIADTNEVPTFQLYLYSTQILGFRFDEDDDDPSDDGPKDEEGEKKQMVKCYRCNGETAVCGFFSEGTVCGQGSAASYPYSSCPDCTDDGPDNEDDSGPDSAENKEKEEITDPVDDGPDVDSDEQKGEQIDPVDDKNDADSIPSREASDKESSDFDGIDASKGGSISDSTEINQDTSSKIDSGGNTIESSILLSQSENEVNGIESINLNNNLPSSMVDLDALRRDDPKEPDGGDDGGGSGPPSPPTVIVLYTKDITTASDLPYSCLDDSSGGSFDSSDIPKKSKKGFIKFPDLYSEVYVGRAPVSDISDLKNFVKKTISYMNSPASNYNKILLVGEHLGFGGVAEYAANSMNELIDNCNHNNINTNGIPSESNIIEKLYAKIRSWGGNRLINIINQGGVNMVNHLGHANVDFNMKIGTPGYTKYGAKSVNLFDNNQYPIFYSQGCFAGAFDSGSPFYGDCIAEYLTVKTGHAGVAWIGNSHFGWGRFRSTDGPSQRYHREFIDAIYGEGKTPLGWANQDSKEDNVGRLDSGPMEWLYYCINLLGDPALKVKGADYDPIDEGGIDGNDGSNDGSGGDNTVIDGDSGEDNDDNGNDATFIDNLRTFLRDLITRIFQI